MLTNAEKKGEEVEFLLHILSEKVLYRKKELKVFVFTILVEDS